MWPSECDKQAATFDYLFKNISKAIGRLFFEILSFLVYSSLIAMCIHV